MSIRMTNSNWGSFYKCPILKKKVNIKKVLKRLRNGSTLKENKETWQINAKCEPRFSPGVEELSAIKYIMWQLMNF